MSELLAGSHIVLGDSLELLRRLPDASVPLIYIDPPFNTGRKQSRRRIRTVRDEDGGDRVGYGGKRYRSEVLGEQAYADRFDDFLAFLGPRLEECHRVLTEDGAFFLHIDYREAHYCKVALDGIFGRDAFMNEIIWAYDYGARSKRKWSAKHDTIFWYVKHPGDYVYDFDAIDRIPYMAPGLVGPEKAAKGKTPTDVWWQTIVPPQSKERTGYPTQKPLPILERIVRVHSRPDDLVLDCFGGSGTTADAAARNGRRFLTVDCNPEAIAVMRERLGLWNPRYVELG